MRQDICSIPISEIFEPKDGCPFCRMRDMLEDRMATYVTGAAMMEPDVRIETNAKGFCRTHFEQILMRGSRLSIALIFESLLSEIDKDLLDPKMAIKKQTKLAEQRENSCFICENIDKNMIHLCKSAINLWQSEAEFRDLYANQTHICMKHYNLISSVAEKEMPRKTKTLFMDVTTKLCKDYMTNLREDVTHFCRMFDYRNTGGDWGTSKDSIERTIEFLTSRKLNASTKTEGKNR